jgi:DNA polymerase elongation subunit (family B)
VAKRKLKRLFFDIEVSPNLVLTWAAGYKQIVRYQEIVRERAVICICWKWEGESKVHSLQWTAGDDKEMLEKFAAVLEEADEVVGHNSDRFDIRWLRTRCLYHGIKLSPYIKGVDTLKLAKAGFRFNSNRLDYIGKFLQVGGKRIVSGHEDLWQSITMHNDQKALDKMIAYCKRDVKLVEDVYHKLEDYGVYKTHAGVLAGKDKLSCPRCASEQTISRGSRVSATGQRKKILSCNDCGRFFSVAATIEKALRKVA